MAKEKRNGTGRRGFGAKLTGAFAAVLLAGGLFAGVAGLFGVQGPFGSGGASGPGPSGLGAFSTASSQAPASESVITSSTSQAAGSAPNPAGSADDSAASGPMSNESAVPEAHGRLVVRFLDVGQGDCALISCDGHHALIDGGPSDASSMLYTVLKNLGIDRLDFIIATHPDADHIGGIAGALNFATCDVCYCSVAESGTRTFANMKRYLEQAESALVVPDVPTVLPLGAATLSIIGPTADFAGDDNNGSLICRLEYGETAFLFMGDAERESEAALLESGVSVAADFLKVGHHGSAYSTTEALVRAVQPAIAVISVGAGNPYGHPTDRVLNLLQAEGVDVYRTDELGTIYAFSDGETIEVSSTRGTITE